MNREDQRDIVMYTLGAIMFIFSVSISLGVYDLNTAYSDSKYIIKQGHNPVGGTSEYTREGNCVIYIDDEKNQKIEKCSENLNIVENLKFKEK